MSWLTSLFSSGTQGIVSGIGDVVDRFVTTGDEQNAMKLELEKVVTARMAMASEQANTEMQAKERIIVAELNQGDRFTKRMRPSLGYFGMLVIFYNYCVVPTVGLFSAMPVEPFSLPTEFWIAWGGMMATYSVGRSMEKRGDGNKVTNAITGNKSLLR